MTDERGAAGGSVRPALALVFATVAFVALLIFGLGMLSLVLNADVVAAPGLGQIPGVIAVIVAMGAFAGALWAGIRSPQPSFWTALWTALAAAAGYIVGLWLGAVFTGADVGVATAAAGRIATSWFGAVVGVSGAIAGWGGVAVVRTRSQRPRWPWEDEFDE
ncbi:MAG: hypothetical protein ABWY37_06335 [Microbacterium pygmaeum]